MYINTTTQVFPMAITIAKAASMAGHKHVGQINKAIKDEDLDYGYVFDELASNPKPQERPEEGSAKFGQKLVILNDKWTKYLDSVKK